MPTAGGPAIKLSVSEETSPIVHIVAGIFKRRVAERCGRAVSVPGTQDLTVTLDLDPDIGTEGFRIEDGPRGKIRILGNDEKGLVYGVGKFLRISRCEPGMFFPGAWRGASVPRRSMRGVYFASHYHNFYHDAPVEKIERYVEDLALWGFNTIAFWFDMYHFRGIDDPEAVAMIERLKRIANAAGRHGLGAAMFMPVNQAYSGSPEELRADWTGGHDGYKTDLSHYHVELCPHKPGGAEQILKYHEDMFKSFADTAIETIVLWPYDTGGCTCSKCKPWGANGFLKMARAVSDLFRRYFPLGKVILSTWLFDRNTTGEWEGLSRAFQDKPDWVDYIMADDAIGRYPRFPLERGVPGNLPMVGFPEISMWGVRPWGGFGANPYPCLLQAMWDEAGASLDGGFTYSEGIFEDINKAICSRFYWDDQNAEDTIREYVASEFSPDVVEEVSSAIYLFEKTLPRGAGDNSSEWIERVPWRFPFRDTTHVDEAGKLLDQANGKLLKPARDSWRWRILYLRGVIDRELVRNDFLISEGCDVALRELTDIYHAQNAWEQTMPPTLERQRSQDTRVHANVWT